MEEVRSNEPNISDFELTERVFGPMVHGTVFCMGSGVRPTHFREDRRSVNNSQRSTSTSRVLEENEQLREQMREMQERDAQRYEELQRVQAQHQEMQRIQSEMQLKEAQRDAEMEAQRQEMAQLRSMFSNFSNYPQFPPPPPPT